MVLIFQDGKSALYYAATSASDNIVKALLAAKADPNITAGVRNSNFL